MAIDIERINQLAKKAKTEGLTPEEKEEQARLRKEYVESVVGNLRAQLDNTYVQSQDGTLTRLTKVSDEPDYTLRVVEDGEGKPAENSTGKPADQPTANSNSQPVGQPAEHPAGQPENSAKSDD